ncbi:NUDIX domain-containing protein [Trinickia dinghuensis]|uniref:GDP-mannose pyrophosphatase n=1 Tax=Trinickia dinghuensis TaxID=2291023 RepID=A0A3D8JUR9_9BURK|nr:NUDIX domain-containing protein [Trinickia dinghuensis]RDU96141.1 GDP-mannose pyrophosphatase [Trinickia dinghuensis]
MHGDARINVTHTEVLSDDWNRLEKVSFDYTRVDGATQSLTREVYHVDDGATALLYDSVRRTVVLVRQFRLPSHLRGKPAYLLEAPAGLLDGSSAEARIKDEIEEEAGYRVKSVERVFEAVMMPGSTGHRVHFFVAPYSPADKVSDGGGLRHEGEDIEVVEMGFDDALAMVNRGEIVDAKTMLLLQYARIHLLPAR